MSLIKNKPTKNKTGDAVSVKTNSSLRNGTAVKKTNGVLQSVKNATVKEFTLLKDISGYRNEELAALVGITHRTIRNKKNNEELFNIAQTERLRKLNLLFEEGNEIFNNKDQFNKWLQKPSYGLDYNIPSELLKQPGGLDKVMNELNSIKYGDTL